MKKCPECSSENPDIASICMHCGASLDVEIQVCPVCHTKNPLNAEQCVHCGHGFIQTGSPDGQTLSQWRFIKKVGRYIYVECDNCHKGFKVNQVRCIEHENGYKVTPAEECPYCDTVSSVIYYAGVEPILQNSVRKERREKRLKLFFKVRRVLVIFNILLLIAVIALGVRGWMRGDFGPYRTPMPTPTRTPRPKKPVISAMPVLKETGRVKLAYEGLDTGDGFAVVLMTGTGLDVPGARIIPL
jgi:ribosomal protein L40E